MKIPKSVKITFLGEPLHTIYPHASRFQVFKYRLFKAIRWTLIRTLVLAGVGGLFITTYKLGQVHPDVSFTREIGAIATPTAFAGETMQAKVDTLKEALLDEMVACENPTHVLVNPDDNKAGTLPLKDKVSIGDLQFKLSTIQHMHKTLTGTTLTDREALMLGLDPLKARELALNAWINIKGSINQWTCASQSMKEKVEIIRFLTK